MLSIVIIAKTGTFSKDGINQYLAKNLPTIQSRDGKPAVLSHIQVAEKTNDSYDAVLLAATLVGERTFEAPTDTLFIAVGEEFGIGELDPVVNYFVQDLECFGWVKYHAHHGDFNCVTFRTKCSEKVSSKIMADANYTTMHLSK